MKKKMSRNSNKHKNVFFSYRLLLWRKVRGATTLVFLFFVMMMNVGCGLRQGGFEIVCTDPVINIPPGPVCVEIENPCENYVWNQGDGFEFFQVERTEYFYEKEEKIAGKTVKSRKLCTDLTDTFDNEKIDYYYSYTYRVRDLISYAWSNAIYEGSGSFFLTTVGTPPGTDSVADLSITQTDTPDPVSVDELLTYNIEVTNNGPDDATDVNVIDLLPPYPGYLHPGGPLLSVTVDSVSSSHGSCSFPLYDIRGYCDLGAINAGDTAMITLNVKPIIETVPLASCLDRDACPAPNKVAVENRDNTAFDPVEENNTATALTVFLPPTGSDISVTTTESNDPIVVNNNLTYTIDVTNNGPDDALGVLLSDRLPTYPGNFLGASITQGTCSETSGIVDCDLGTIPDGDTVTISLVLEPTAPTAKNFPWRNEVEVTTLNTDPYLSNNEVISTTVVLPTTGSDLAVEKTAFPPQVVVVNNILSYLLTVTNNGPDDATGVFLSDKLPFSETGNTAPQGNFVNASSSQGTCIAVDDVVDCDFGTIPTGTSVKVTINVRPTRATTSWGSSPGVPPWTNEVEVSTTGTDPYPINNEASATTIVIPAAGSNTAPTAEDDAYSVDENDTLNEVLPGVLGNDPDAQGDPLQAALVGSTSNGALTLNTDGSFTYVPDTDYFGVDFFTYMAYDGNFYSNVAIVAITVIDSSINFKPVADAGTDQVVDTGDFVMLDGAVSSDPDGDSLTYSWSFSSKPTGSSASLIDDTTVSPTFTPDLDGAYIVSLVVNDGLLDSDADQVTITSSINAVPIADAGADQDITTDSLVTLDASASSDADGDPLTFSWSFDSKPAGSSAALSDSTVVDPIFTADVDGDYVFTLIVNDGIEDSLGDKVTITASRPDPNSLSLHWPIDIGLFPPQLFLSPGESQFAGVAYLAGDYDIRFTVVSYGPDARNTCGSLCPAISKPRVQDLSYRYPDGADISVDQSAGNNFGRWTLEAQIYDTVTGLDYAGSESFDVIVDPGAFQVVIDGVDLTLSLFGDMPSASTTDAVGSCAAGEAEWTLTDILTTTTIDTKCVDVTTLVPGTITDWSFTNLTPSAYSAALRYVDASPANLGIKEFQRSFWVVAP